MKKLPLLIALLITSSSGFSYVYISDFRVYPVGSKEWKQQQYEQEQEEKQEDLERRLAELEEKQQELEDKKLYGY